GNSLWRRDTLRVAETIARGTSSVVRRKRNSEGPSSPAWNRTPSDGIQRAASSNSSLPLAPSNSARNASESRNVSAETPTEKLRIERGFAVGRRAVASAPASGRRQTSESGGA